MLFAESLRVISVAKTEKIGGALEKLGLSTNGSGNNKENIIRDLKSMRYDDGTKVFHFSDDVLGMIAEEALTGKPQQYPNMTEPDKLTRARNTAKNHGGLPRHR